MNKAISFSQVLSTYNEAAPSKTELELATALINEGRRLASEAKSEANSGDIVEALTQEADQCNDHTLRRNMAAIAVWHHEYSAQKYHLAASRLREAGKINIAKSQQLNDEAEILAARAMQCETSAQALAGFIV